MIDRAELMKFAKISTRQTYTKLMQELELFGYIKYIPSHDPKEGSRVELVELA